MRTEGLLSRRVWERAYLVSHLAAILWSLATRGPVVVIVICVDSLLIAATLDHTYRRSVVPHLENDRSLSPLSKVVYSALAVLPPVLEVDPALWPFGLAGVLALAFAQCARLAMAARPVPKALEWRGSTLVYALWLTLLGGCNTLLGSHVTLGYGFMCAVNGGRTEVTRAQYFLVLYLWSCLLVYVVVKVGVRVNLRALWMVAYRPAHIAPVLCGFIAGARCGGRCDGVPYVILLLTLASFVLGRAIDSNYRRNVMTAPRRDGSEGGWPTFVVYGALVALPLFIVAHAARWAMAFAAVLLLVAVRCMILPRDIWPESEQWGRNSLVYGAWFVVAALVGGLFIEGRTGGWWYERVCFGAQEAPVLSREQYGLVLFVSMCLGVYVVGRLGGRRGVRA